MLTGRTHWSQAMHTDKHAYVTWAAISCAVPLAALAAVMLYGAPVMLSALVGLLVLVVISPRLLAAAAGPRAQGLDGSTKDGEPDRATPGRAPEYPHSGGWTK